MVALPGRPEQAMTERLYQAVVISRAKKMTLTRLGASSIGEECLRKTFYGWRRYSLRQPDGRMSLLFESGDIYEKRAIENLRLIGLKIWDKDPDTGKQYFWAHPSGHFVVNPDGVCRGVITDEKTPHILEVKSHNDRNFRNLENRGVKQSHPEHYIQMQMEMHGFGLSWALYVGVNKNDDAYYFERVPYDEATAASINRKIDTLVAATLTPAGVSQTASAPPCRFCYHKRVCVGEEAPLRHCRTCRNVQAVANPESKYGDWYCNFHNKLLSYGDQLKGCDFYDSTQEGRSLGAYLQSG